MPRKEFTGGGPFGVIAQAAHGHRARRRDYENLSDEELYRAIDERRNVTSPSEIDFSEGDTDSSAQRGEEDLR